MSRKTDQTQIDTLIQAQIQFLEDKDCTDPWQGGDGKAHPPMGALPFRLFPQGLDQLLGQLVPTMTEAQKARTADNLAMTLTTTRIREGLAERGVFGQSLAKVDSWVGNGSSIWETVGILDIERMWNPSFLIKDVVALGQVTRDCPSWFPRTLGDDNTRAIVARNLLVFLQRGIMDLRKTQRKTPMSLEHPKKLQEVAHVLSGALPLLDPSDVGAWIGPACTVAGHLHVYGVELPPTHCQHPLDQIQSQDPLQQDGLTVLKRAVLRQAAQEATPEKTPGPRRRI